MAPATCWTRRSWSSPPRTRSRWKAPTRCPKRSGTGSPREFSSATRAPRPSWPCSTCTAPRPRWTRWSRWAARPACGSWLRGGRGVPGAEPLKQYVISRVSATRSAPDLRLGASPRATLHLLRASRARAALDGRDFVIPDDVQALALPVLAHRMLPSAEALLARQLPEQVLAAIVGKVP